MRLWKRGAGVADVRGKADGAASSNDALVRRLVSLVVAFSNASTPLSSEDIRSEYYPDVSVDTFQKQFRRDRERLVLCGLTVRETPRGGWAADETSFADRLDLDPTEVAALDITCLQLVEDPSFPYRDDLRLALAKIDSGYEAFPRAAAPQASAQDRNVLALLRAQEARHAVRVTYTDAHGRTSERTLAVWGVFGLRGHTYFIAPELDAERGEPRTWRDDRFGSVRELGGVSYRIPPDFCAEDYRRLPFQIGAAQLYVTFRVPKTATEEARSAMAANGEVEENPQTGREYWTVEASDLNAAARWAVANGLVPTSPVALAEVWRDLLKEATHAC